MKHESITCDNCGIVKGAEFSGPYPISPYVWFAISRDGHSRGIEPVPRMSMMPSGSGQPDLCSWKCVAAYAQEHAERAERALAADAGRAAAE
jgi:hypothetical protein